ncbi:MAG: exodeoxyribonuclease III [Desulfobulbaceae bacterium]|jgi:exodeoxyribonuclease-3|nr:exodeoxyribonuclease III [Desulfobulbaceae bacterium]
MTIDIHTFLPRLQKEVATYQVPVVDLIGVQTRDPFKVLVATILSARTKDETTAKASARLFAKGSTPAELAALSEEELRRLIYPVGFYKNKAKYLSKLPEALSPFANKVPDEMDDLLTLPGVGRKTANLVLAVAFKKPAICVDTHVHRIMNIWGYVDTKTPEQTERALRKKLPGEYWLTVNSTLVAFGQGTCKPVSPHCDRCLLQPECPQTGVTPRRRITQKKTRYLRLLSWNVNGIRAAEKKGFIDLIEGLGPDVLALQETKAHPEQLSDELKNIQGYEVYFASAEKKGYSGVAIYTRHTPLQVITGIGHPEFDNEGRTLTLEFATYFLVNCYFPNSQHGLKRMDYKIGFNEAVHGFIDELATRKTVVLCGDLNVAHKEIDLANPETNMQNPGFTPEERQWMDQFLSTNYIDTFRMFNTGPEHYSWWSYRFNARARNIGWRIDYFIVDAKSTDRVKSAAILPHIMGSDHCPVEMVLKL